MNNHKIVAYTVTDVFKTAFKVGFGIKLGIEIGGFVNYTMLKTIKEVLDKTPIKCAKNGSESAKNSCKHFGLDYDDEDSVKSKIGFHCE